MPFRRAVPSFPFLDHTFVEATLALPGHAIVKDGMTKSILRRALRGVVPDAILERRDKIGFGTPEDTWFRQPALRDVIRDAIESPVLKSARSTSMRSGAFSHVIWRAPPTMRGHCGNACTYIYGCQICVATLNPG
jgi:asparagine synthetase B (glutamine-hydrolysing)